LTDCGWGGNGSSSWVASSVVDGGEGVRKDIKNEIRNIIDITQLGVIWTEGLPGMFVLNGLQGVQRIVVLKRITGTRGAYAAGAPTRRALLPEGRCFAEIFIIVKCVINSNNDNNNTCKYK